ncbi:siderophore-interacting protein [Rhizobium mongolense]|uniref:NADPH-dependent ferric siderophore reductase n=2 Tax=Rhizobium mongolense TaxID=57676 RepID=A0ABR6IM97_9HYPH|nr:siderophore-interacting protein [Rhizobium mongolense]MBB4229018.1 NADPH-dependent ferric siderophore reductase [Rhizobium mongolense]TVZ63426.1 NADPH-dependent ferric siderophore reductase [Rhizobium mongolense USDA 1844]
MTVDTASKTTENRHRIERVRRDVTRRVLVVRRIARLTPQMLRITLAGPDLHDFVSLGHDDHVKILVPRAGEEPVFPDMSPEGRIDPANKPALRDYTPRRFDAVTGELDLDFALHETGPATEWALRAQPGDMLGVGGPRGSFVVATDFDWYLLVGDETALPAIGRRLEELPASAHALVVAEVAGPEEEQALESKARLTTLWLHRGASPAGTTDQLDQALRGLTLPVGDGYVWIACEILIAKRLRAIMVDERQHPKAWIKAAGYWKRGQADFHETHGD